MYKTILNPLNWKFWIVFSIFISFGHFYLSINYNGLSLEKPFVKTGDSFDYITSSQSFLINNEYVFFKTSDWVDKSNLIPDDNYDKPLYYAYRPPGYAFVLIPLFKFFYYNTALKYIVFLQVILYGLAIYLLCLISYRLFNKKNVFYLTFFLLSISLSSSFWNVYIYTESLAISFLIFSIFFLLKGFDSKSNFYFFISGLCMTEAIFLRSFLAPVLIVHVFLIIRKYGFKKSFLTLIIYIMPFLLIDGVWTVRNYLKTDEIIPLASTATYHKYRNKAFLKQLDIYINLGITFSFNEWFFNEEDKNLPQSMYVKGFLNSKSEINEMILAKRYYLNSLNESYSKDKRAEFEYKSFKIQENLLSEFIINKKINWFSTRLSTSKILLNQGPVHINTGSSILNLVFDYLQKVLNNFIFYIGLLALIFALYRFKSNLEILSLIFIPLFLFLFFTVINLAEKREMFIPSFFMLVFAVEFLNYLLSKKRWIVIIGIFTIVLMF